MYTFDSTGAQVGYWALDQMGFQAMTVGSLSLLSSSSEASGREVYLASAADVSVSYVVSLTGQLLHTWQLDVPRSRRSLWSWQLEADAMGRVW